MSNYCDVTEDEYFRELKDCTMVNDDGSLNYDDEYIKMAYGNSDNLLADRENIFENE